MRPAFQWLWHKYNDAMFCVAVTGTFIGQPLRFVNETLLITNTAILMGYAITGTAASLFFLCVTGFATITGMILIRMGYVRKQTTLSNENNPLLLELREQTRIINQRMNRLEDLYKGRK